MKTDKIATTWQIVLWMSRMRFEFLLFIFTHRNKNKLFRIRIVMILVFVCVTIISQKRTVTWLLLSNSTQATFSLFYSQDSNGISMNLTEGRLWALNTESATYYQFHCHGDQITIIEINVKASIPLFSHPIPFTIDMFVFQILRIASQHNFPN